MIFYCKVVGESGTYILCIDQITGQFLETVSLDHCAVKDGHIKQQCLTLFKETTLNCTMIEVNACNKTYYENMP